jgi:hypothetical protein
MFEMNGVPPESAKEAMRLAMHKLPIKCKFMIREGGAIAEVVQTKEVKEVKTAEPEATAAPEAEVTQ